MIEWDYKTQEGNIIFHSEELYQAKLGPITLSVHTGFGDNTGLWFASSELFKRTPLKSKKLSEAKCQAVAMLQVTLQDAIADIRTSTDG